MGILQGLPDVERGREAYDRQAGIVLTYQGSDGAGARELATYTVSADCLGKASYPGG